MAIVVYRLDLAYSRLRVCFEFDGVEFHSRRATRHDEERRAWLQAQGWEVIVVRKEDFTAARIEAWTGELRAIVELSGVKSAATSTCAAGGAMSPGSSDVVRMRRDPSARKLDASAVANLTPRG